MSSQVTINTADDLEIFLKILAEESVKEAREEIKAISSDPAQKALSKSQQNRSIKNLKPIQEVEEEEADEEVEAQDQEAEEPSVGDEESGDQADVEAEAEKKKDADTVKSDIEVSLDSITDTIKMLRSGRSVDDSQVKSQMRRYYDRLNDPERKVLLTFMRSFAGILTGQMTGSDASDPSEPPLNMKISQSDSESQSSNQASGQAQSQGRSNKAQVGSEDTSPPIKVGSSQKMSEIRQKVKELMKS
tara:strand:+ start:326 stop:1063 length:738 start_codon:yes stop_codon:yes gene_type:complete